MGATARVQTPETPEDGDGRKTYNRSYYEDHRAEIAERRRQKYSEDEEYRQRRLEAARKYRERKQQDRERKAERRGQEYVRRRGGPRKPLEVTVNGQVELAYTISTLAKRSKRPMATLRAWRNRGLFPQTPFVTARGDTLYTKPMISAFCAALRRYPRMTTDSAFRADVEGRWNRLGIPVGSKVVVQG